MADEKYSRTDHHPRTSAVAFIFLGGFSNAHPRLLIDSQNQGPIQHDWKLHAWSLSINFEGDLVATSVNLSQIRIRAFIEQADIHHLDKEEAIRAYNYIIRCGRRISQQQALAQINAIDSTHDVIFRSYYAGRSLIVTVGIATATEPHAIRA